MSGHCPMCGTYHEEDDDRICSGCVIATRKRNIEDTEPIDILSTRVWAGNKWAYPHIERMIAELKALRKQLADQAVPDGFVRTDDGQVRKVLGTLSMTKDGCVIGTDAFVWTMECANPAGIGWMVLNGAENRHAEKGYSTRDGAKAAIDAAGGKED